MDQPAGAAAVDPVERTLMAFVYANFPLARQASIGTTDPLLESGIVDSLGLLLIVDFIEATYGIVVKDVDMRASNFGCVAAVGDFVRRAS
jgi:acyl carrier protein